MVQWCNIIFLIIHVVWIEVIKTFYKNYIKNRKTFKTVLDKTLACNTAQGSCNSHLSYWNTELCILLTATVKGKTKVFISVRTEKRTGEIWEGCEMVSSAVITLATARAAAWWFLYILTCSKGLLHLFWVFTVSISISTGRSFPHMRKYFETCLQHSKANVGFVDYRPVKFRKYHDVDRNILQLYAEQNHLILTQSNVR